MTVANSLSAVNLIPRLRKNVKTKAGISKATQLDFGYLEGVKTFNGLFGKVVL